MEDSVPLGPTDIQFQRNTQEAYVNYKLVHLLAQNSYKLSLKFPFEKIKVSRRFQCCDVGKRESDLLKHFEFLDLFVSRTHIEV